MEILSHCLKQKAVIIVLFIYSYIGVGNMTFHNMSNFISWWYISQYCYFCFYTIFVIKNKNKDANYKQ